MSVPAEVATIGKTVDADIAAIKAHLAALEAAAAAKEHAFVNWFKSPTNLLHLVNAGQAAVIIGKLFGKL